jgi:hypothetical protein
MTAHAAAAPAIRFDQTTIDFGKTSQVATVSGVFKFKNVGDSALELQPPKPSCGCTVAELKTNMVAPGAIGELPFTLNLGQYRANLEKHISVHSNDPKTPEVSLTIKVDYTPLFEFKPATLSPNLPFGTNAVEQSAALERTDGKPLRITRLEGSQPWITAIAEPDGKGNDAATRIRISIQREGTPRRFSEYVHVYTADQTNAPAASIYIYGQVMGEISLSPESLYWSLIDEGKTAAARPESVVVRRVTIRSANGGPFELKNPQSTIKGIKLDLAPTEGGKAYELVARLDEPPVKTLSGTVSFETSVAAQSRIEVPVIVNVFKP